MAKDFFPEPGSSSPSPRERPPPSTPPAVINNSHNTTTTTTIEEGAKIKHELEETKSVQTPSPKKKKAPYVPPAPITALLAENESSAEPTEEQSFNDLLQQQQQAGTNDEAEFLELANEPIEDWDTTLEFQEQSNNDSHDGSGSNNHMSADNSTVVSTATSAMTYPDDTPEPSSTSGMRFDELYRLKGVLGTGAFSTVREGYHRSNTSVGYAVKCINRKKLSEEDEAALLDEVSILQELKHQHIIRLFDFFEETSTYYLVMETMRGGELFDRIVAKAYYNEKEARDTCKIVLEAVQYCHENHVAHRDLKPENLLLQSDVDDSLVKIADFGFAKKVYAPNSLTTQCGTPGYVAPEILEGTAYDERADMWSVGVILYILLGGYPPFIESTQRDLFRKIRKGEYEFHEEYWGTVSAEAKELISSLLTVDATHRLTASQGLRNSWILGDDAVLAAKGLNDNLEKLRNFNGKRKFRAAVSAIMAANKLNFMGKEFYSKASNGVLDLQT